tara:strand:+ start:547 stop:741 length:195 start_codon:yes stop_codon:yes gene_type:complete
MSNYEKMCENAEKREQVFEQEYEKLYADTTCKLQGDDFEHEVIRLAQIQYEKLNIESDYIYLLV